MKIIVSHDVDHLYPSDHILRDFIFPKLWVRSTIQAFRGEISFGTLYNRFVSIFDKRLCRIPEIIDFDMRNDVKSTFYFGMDNVLGMSYHKKKALPWIHYVCDKGGDVGVHGVEIEDVNKMRMEYKAFATISRLNSFGIRTHYVRYNEMTFSKMAKIGYLYDTSEFDKKKVNLKLPYKIGDMWEFPLYIMDGYIMKNGLDKAKEETMQILKDAERKGIAYFTFLFHDYMYNDKTYPNDKEYYEWFIRYCVEKQYQFTSYTIAIKELNENV